MPSLAIVGSLAISGCAASRTHSDTSELRADQERIAPATPELVDVDRLEMVETGDITHWVSYGDITAVATVVSERQSSEQPARTEVPEYAVKRDVTIDIESIEWTYPGGRGTIAPGESIVLRHVGWWKNTEQDELIPIHSTGIERLEVGSTYLMTLAWNRDKRWVPISKSIVKTVGPEVAIPLRTSSAGVAEIAGLTVARVSDILEGTEPDPRITKYHELPIDAQMLAVAKENRSE